MDSIITIDRPALIKRLNEAIRDFNKAPNRLDKQDVWNQHTKEMLQGIFRGDFAPSKVDAIRASAR